MRPGGGAYSFDRSCRRNSSRARPRGTTHHKARLASAGHRAGSVGMTRARPGATTEALAAELKTRLASGEHLALLIGGPEGLAPECLQQAHANWA